MSIDLPSVSHRVAELEPRISIEGPVCTTAAFTVQKAIFRNSGERVTVIRLRMPLAVDDPSAVLFTQRAHILGTVGLIPVAEVGVDNTSLAFAIRPHLDGTALTAGKIEGAESERRFLSAARLIARAHEAGVCFGELSGNSWWVNRDGDVALVNPCSIADLPREQIVAHLPKGSDQTSNEWREMLAPEFFTGGSITAASDVYSLGVLGQKLLAPLMHSHRGAYLVPILEAATASDPMLRPDSAGTLLKQLQEARAEYTRSLTVKGRPETKNRETGTHAVVAQVGASPELAQPKEPPPPPRKIPQPKSRPLVVGALGTLIVVTFIMGTRMAAQQQQASKEHASRRAQLEMVAGNPSLEQAVRILSATQAGTDERKLELEKLTNSDDPLAHEILVRAALDAQSETERLFAERAIVERARRLGLLRVAESSRSWLRKLTGTTLPAIYEPLLRLMNGSLPESARVDLVKQILAYDQEFATNLAASVALDTEQPRASVQLLSDLVAQRQNESVSTDSQIPLPQSEQQKQRPKTFNGSPRSLIALLLADRGLSIQFADDIVQRREGLADSDFSWVLPILAERNDPSLRPIAALALLRRALPAIPSAFLELIRDRDDLTTEQTRALVRSAVGQPTVEDIAVFGRWLDTGAERSLLALCAMLPSGSRESIEAFDTLAGRSIVTEPAATLVGWIRQHRWEQRSAIIKPIAQVALADRQSVEEVAQVLKENAASIANSAVLEVLVRTSTPQISAMLVERFTDKLGVGSLVNLLLHPDPKVRIAAISGLTDVNEAAILRLIADRYDRERDEQVRKAYETKLWVIRERVRR